MFVALTTNRSSRLLSGLLLGCLLIATSNSRGETSSWAEPDIDTWAYTNGFSPGSRFLAPSFGGIGFDTENNQFFEGSSGGPSRLGAFVFAFETTDQITPGLDFSRYSINSVTVTARIQSGSTGILPYYEDSVSAAQLLAQAQGGGISAEQPLELFGVGFRNGFDGFALGANQTASSFNESDPVYSAQGYGIYPIAGDGAGGYSDVSNSYTGGFSETAPGNQVSPFDPESFAIGKIDGLSNGDAVANDSTYNFELDLSADGLVDYLQQGLSDGVVSFFLSSAHSAAQPGQSGGGAYPQWYAKEAIGIYPNAEAPTLTIDYTILPELIPGDFNSDGDVNTLDYDAWVTAYGTSVTNPGDGADGNQDGVVDAADYTVWRDNFTAPASLQVAVAVPEPSSLTMMSLFGATFAFCGWMRWYTN